MKTILLSLVCLMSFQILLSQSINNGLVANYLFNGDLKDQTNYQNHGTPRGSVAYGMDRFGSKCGAVEFNGRDAFISVPSSRSLESPVSSVTISVWFKTHRNSDKMQWFTIACKGTDSNESQNSPQYRLQGTSMTLSLNTDFTEFINLPIQNDTWYHYVMTWTGTLVTSYLNGRQVFTYPYSDKLSANSQPLYIGRDIPGTDEFFFGSMDQLQIYNRALSANEVNQLFQDQSERGTKKPCDPIAQAPVTNGGPIAIPYLNGIPPTVNILIPNKNPSSTEMSQQTLWANIQDIAGAESISVKINGKPFKPFTFNTKRNMLEFQFLANPGQNLVEIVAMNEYGTDRAETEIVLNRKEEVKPPKPVTTPMPTQNKLPSQDPAIAQVGPPTVMIINPSEDVTTMTVATHRIWAKLSNMTSKDKINPVLNGVILNHYNFDEKAGLFDANVTLKEGLNTFKITVQNKAGGDSDIRQLVYIPVLPKPVIELTDPSTFPSESTDSQTSITAKIENVTSKQNIEFQVNSQKLDFNFDVASGIFISQFSLDEGYNVFEISATNQQGTDKTVEQILYKRTDPIQPKPDLGTIQVIDTIVIPSKTISIACYDHNRIDGDIVSVVMNDEVIFDKITLEAKEQQKAVKEITLLPGKSYVLVSKAWNEGKVPTNTLCVEISDQFGFSKVIKLNSKEGTSEAIRFQYQ